MDDGDTNEFLGWFVITFTKILCSHFLKFILLYSTDTLVKFYLWIGCLHFTTQCLHLMLVFLHFLLNKMQLKKILINIPYFIAQVKNISTLILKYFGNGLSFHFGMVFAAFLVRWFLLRVLWTQTDFFLIIGLIQQVHLQSLSILLCSNCSLSQFFGIGFPF